MVKVCFFYQDIILKHLISDILNLSNQSFFATKVLMNYFRQFIFALLFACVLTPTYAGRMQVIEQKLSDTLITTKITTSYAQHKNLSLLKLMVSTQDGVVKLRGHVNDNQAFVDALRIAKNTQGVLKVNVDDLEIKRVNTQFTDVYITTKVEAAILVAKVFDDESIPLVGIHASTYNGIVTLTGDLKNLRSIDFILKRANKVAGVKKIISHLSVN